MRRAPRWGRCVIQVYNHLGVEVKMSEHLYRAQILIEQGQRKTLAQIAHEEGRSISDVARELIRLGLEARSETPEMRWRKRDRALEQAAEVRAAILRRRGGRPIDLDP